MAHLMQIKNSTVAHICIWLYMYIYIYVFLFIYANAPVYLYTNGRIFAAYVIFLCNKQITFIVITETSMRMCLSSQEGKLEAEGLSSHKSIWLWIVSQPAHLAGNWHRSEFARKGVRAIGVIFGSRIWFNNIQHVPLTSLQRLRRWSRRPRLRQPEVSNMFGSGKLVLLKLENAVRSIKRKVLREI